MKSLVLIGLALVACTFAVDEKSAMEQACIKLDDKVVPVHMPWVRSVKMLYYTMMTRLELYRVARDLTGKEYNEIPESSIYYDGCIKWTPEENSTYVAHGFDGKSRTYKTTVLSPNFEMFDLKPLEGTGLTGRAYSTMTDNSTYLVTPICNEDGQMTFGVATTIEKLPTETVHQIKDHLISLGFKKEFMTQIRYDSCPKQE